MDNLKPEILRYFKINNIDIFKLSEQERNDKINEFKTMKRDKLLQKMRAYNKMYYQQKKDTYFKTYYENNFNSIAEKSKIRYKNKNNSKKQLEL